MCYLNKTEMAAYVPSVGPWVAELNGFWMEYLHEPSPDMWGRLDWPAVLGNALRTLHNLPLPPVSGLVDDRPDVVASICNGLQSIFDSLVEDVHWNALTVPDQEHLQFVRARRESYLALLPVLQETLPGDVCALVHGDLSGGNFMLCPDGSPVLADWGEARLALPFTDVAYLIAHMEWDEQETERFLDAYFGADMAIREAAYPSIEILIRLYRYQACVRSLLWLNAGDLDAVGYAYFLRQLSICKK